MAQRQGVLDGRRDGDPAGDGDQRCQADGTVAGGDDIIALASSGG